MSETSTDEFTEPVDLAPTGRSRHVPARVALLVAVGLMTAACGGDDDASSPASAATPVGPATTTDGASTAPESEPAGTTDSSLAELSVPEAEDTGPDRDLDGVDDNVDNCPDDDNGDQSDADEDGVGDVCDEDKSEQPNGGCEMRYLVLADRSQIEDGRIGAVEVTGGGADDNGIPCTTEGPPLGGAGLGRFGTLDLYLISSEVAALPGFGTDPSELPPGTDLTPEEVDELAGVSTSELIASILVGPTGPAQTIADALSTAAEDDLPDEAWQRAVSLNPDLGPTAVASDDAGVAPATDD